MAHNPRIIAPKCQEIASKIVSERVTDSNLNKVIEYLIKAAYKAVRAKMFS